MTKVNLGKVIGDSAYETWLAEGNTGTEEDFLKSLIGETGNTGAEGRGISKIEKTNTVGLIDTYTITYTDGTTSTYEVKNGADGTGGGEGGTSDYTALENLPSVNGVQLVGNKTALELGVASTEKVTEAFDSGMVTDSVVRLPDAITETLVNVTTQETSTKVFCVGKNWFPAGRNIVVNEGKTEATKDFIKTINLPVTYPAGSYRFGALVETSHGTTTTCLVRALMNGTYIAGGNISANSGAVTDVSIVSTQPFNQIALYSGSGNTGAKLNSATYSNICLTYDNLQAKMTDETYEAYIGEIYDLPANNIIVKASSSYLFTDDLVPLQATYRKQKSAFASPNPYYFADNYLNNKVAEINDLMETSAINGDAFIFITDQHIDDNGNAGQSLPLIKYIGENTKVNKLFSGGDVCSAGNNFTDHRPSAKKYAQQMAQAFNGEIHYTPGNHEYDRLTEAELFYTYNINKKEQIGDIGRNYYYVDNPQQKMRYIMLNTYEPYTDGVADNGSKDLAEGGTQLTWFKDVALNVEEGWGIIIFTHSFHNRAWSANANYISEAGVIKPVRAVIDEYNGNGEIIAVFHGHIHQDMFKRLEISGVPVIGTTCDKFNGTAGTELLVTRTAGTISEQAFDVVIVDRTERLIHCVRIGANARDGAGYSTDPEVGTRTYPFREVTGEE